MVRNMKASHALNFSNPLVLYRTNLNVVQTLFYPYYTNRPKIFFLLLYTNLKKFHEKNVQSFWNNLQIMQNNAQCLEPQGFATTDNNNKRIEKPKKGKNTYYIISTPI